MIYSEKFGCIPHEKQSAKWIEAWAYFDRVSAEMRPMAKKESGNGFSEIKGALKCRKN